MDIKKLFHKNFILLIAGQTISLFANAILRFSLLLYVLDITGSATVFGGISAMAIIPMILLTPMAGILADRANRKNIMVALDACSAVIVLGFGLFLSDNNAVVLVGVAMILMSVLGAFETPTVNSSIPSLSSENNLVKANAVVNQINALSNLLGPILGGMLYGIWGLMPIVIISGIGFCIAAFIEIFIKMPYRKAETQMNLRGIIKSDFKESFDFIRNKKPVLLQTTSIVFVFNMFFYSMMQIGIPYIIKVVLGLNSQLYGLAQGAMSGGALLGGILIGIFSSKAKINKAHWLFLFATVIMAPVGLTLFLKMPAMVSYAVIMVCGIVFMGLCTIFTIVMLSFVQQQSPNHLVGKVVAYVMTFCMVSQPVGQWLYGVLFNTFTEKIYGVIFITVIINVFITLASKRTFSKIKS